MFSSKTQKYIAYFYSCQTTLAKQSILSKERQGQANLLELPQEDLQLL